MTKILVFFRGLLAGTLKVLLGLVLAALALVLLALALLLVGIVMLWALLRGRRPVPPPFAGRFQRYASARVWPGGVRRTGAQSESDVLDVEVREVVAHGSGAEEPEQQGKKDRA